MHNLKQAREWAEDGKGLYSLGAPVKAVIDIILSLPDHWVDVEKVQEIIEKMETPKNKPIEIGYDLGVVVATEAWRIQLQALIATKLPTLADMTEEERKACRWMQCKITHSDQIHVIARPELKVSALWREDGYVIQRNNDMITPLPGPKLQWPGGVVDCEIADEEKVRKIAGEIAEWSKNLNRRLEPEDSDHQQPNSSETPKSSIKPEDVPPNEPWLIEVDGQKAIGTRYQVYTDVPWSVAVLDGAFAGDYSDNDVTLIHKLVPETHTLPKGMRIADERTLGRVIVTTEFNEDDICEIVYWNKGLKRNCPGFADENDITFLDGNQ